MAESRKKTEEAIFYMALEKSPDERNTCLREACGDDRVLFSRVEALLRAREIEDDFLQAPVLDPDMTLDNSSPTEGPGTVIGRYKLLERIGEGGMAVVYMAEQAEPIRRKVALKIIKLGMDTKQVIARFEAERQALAMMDHPSIAKVFDAGATDTGRPYFVMELVRGISITEYCDKHKLGTSERLELFIEVCNAVQHAHQKGIIHRDIKPSNVMVVLRDGKPAPKVIDFGIAKATNQRLTDKTLLTRHAQIIGTPAYMSPEQAEMSGLDIDTRTDIYSLGVLLYELLTGTTPFDGARLHSAGYVELQRIIREEDPTRPSTKLSSLSDRMADIARHRNTQPDVLAKSIRGDLDWIVMKSLEKDRTRRYETAHAFAEDVQRHLRNEPILARRPSVVYRLHKFCRRNRYKLAVAAVILVLVSGILVSLATHAANLKVQWARREALPVITKLVEQGDYLPAFFLAGQAEKHIPEDPILVKLWPQMSRPISVTTEPPGAEVYYRDYSDMEGEWLHFGRSPLETNRFPRGVYRWKVIKEGFETRESTTEGAASVKLQAKNSYPEMVLILSESCGNYLIDKYEVTNEQFKVFVDDGGYERQEYWKYPFVKDEHELSWEEGIRQFRDKTGRPGPADWEGGIYPEGQKKYPVSGISWFEAAAYAEYAGKSLPTVSHWYEAADTEQANLITPYSNFRGKPASVGTYQGIGRNGLYDMAGNVREWCWNTVEGSPQQKCILGGSCADPEYMFVIRDTLTAWDRSAENGLRCVSYPGGRDSLLESIFEPERERFSRDARKVSPLSEEEFASCLELYSYDQAEIEADVEHVNDGSASWQKQRITFDAAYGGERMTAYLFLPNGIAPPYQPVVYCPSANALVQSESGDLRDMGWVRLLAESGRAVLYPIYKGTYDRNFEGGRPDALKQPIAYRNWYVQMYQDLARSIDYLQSRDDVDMTKLTYFGTSWGAANGPLFIALEKRIRNAVLIGAGCFHKSFPPFADPIRFAPHVKASVTMFNGTDDTFFPYESSQKPLFDLLGPDSKRKTHKRYPGGHVITGSSAKQLQRDILECLGPVDAK